MKSKLGEIAIPPLRLTPEQESAIAEEADRIVKDTIAASDEFLAYGHKLPTKQWKRVKTKSRLTVFRTRKGFESPAPVRVSYGKPSTSSARGSTRHRARASTLEVDRMNFASGSSTPHSRSTSHDNIPSLDATMETDKIPLVVLTGIIPGTIEDAAYGNIAANEAVWKLRNTYLKDPSEECKILSMIAGPSRDDPYRCLTVKWTLKKLASFVSMRDLVYTESAGAIRDAEGNITVAYSLVHSIELPGVPELTQYNVHRLKVSMCFLARPYDDKSVELYCRAYCFDSAGLMKSIGTLLYAEVLLVSTRVMECAHMKKLMWLAHHRRRNKIQYTNQSLETATHCQGCLRGLKLFGGLTRSASTCQCCKRIVCGRCTSQREVIVDLTEDGGVTQKALPFCPQCVVEAIELPAEDIALASIGV